MNLRLQVVLAFVLLAIVFAGCSPRHYRKSADKEAYNAIRSKSPQVTNMPTGFSIEQTSGMTLENFPVTTNAPGFLGPEGAREIGAHVLTLEDALLLAVNSSRRFQSQKESLYLSALSLTLARHAFTPIFSASADVAHTVDEITRARDPLGDRLVNRAGTSVGASWLIRDVGRITTDLTVDALRLVVGDRHVATSSRMGARFTRPLLRNAGFKAEMESLTQSERNLLYALRNFVQFRKDFTVQTASEYYDVLGARDRVRNSYLNLESSRRNAERSRALAQEGRERQTSLGRLEQAELSAESSWINALRNYQQSLDNFKLSLGLNVSNNIVLDDRELDKLRILDPNLAVEDSIAVALAARLDFLNLKEELEDSIRRVALAENFLKPRVDFTAGAAMVHDPASRSLVALPDPTRYSWNAGLAIDPGLDRKSERNSYRSALIARNRAARELEQREDTIRLEVRDSWRTLDQAKRNYEIAEIGVRLAERRVEEQDILAELGRANAQDQVDAQNALIDSKNQRTQAIVTHNISRLRFWNRLGILYIQPDGQWEETNDVENNQTL
jgi:outer membrane protein TolC